MACKKTIVKKLMENNNLTRNNAREIVDQVFTTIKDALINGEIVIIKQFGTFSIKEIKPFKRYHPTKKEFATYNGGKRIKLKTSRMFRDTLEAA